MRPVIALLLTALVGCGKPATPGPDLAPEVERLRAAGNAFRDDSIAVRAENAKLQARVRELEAKLHPPTPAPVPKSERIYLDPERLRVGDVGYFPEGQQWSDAGKGDINFVTLVRLAGGKFVLIVVPRKRVAKVESDVLVDSKTYTLPGLWEVTGKDEYAAASRPKFELMPKK